MVLLVRAFIAMVKNRITKQQQKNKHKPTFPHHENEKLKKIRNQYYHLCQRKILYKVVQRQISVITIQ
jgi:hypothetical protein